MMMMMMMGNGWQLSRLTAHADVTLVTYCGCVGQSDKGGGL